MANNNPVENTAKSGPRFHELVCGEVPVMVAIEVGPERKRYHLLKVSLTFHSEYFRRALQGPWREAEEGVIKLDDVNIDAWNLFVNWLYSQTLPGQPARWTGSPTLSSDELADLKDEWAEATGDPEAEWFDVCMSMIEASVLSDRLMVPAFGRAVRNSLVTMDAFNYSRTDEASHFPIVLFNYACDHIEARHPLMQYFVYYWCRYMDGLPPYKRKANPERGLRRKFMRQAEWWLERANGEAYCFLEHVNDKEEYACSKQFHLAYAPGLETMLPYASKTKQKISKAKLYEEQTGEINLA